MRRTMEVVGLCALAAMFLSHAFADPPASPPAADSVTTDSAKEESAAVEAADEEPAEEPAAPQIAEGIRQKLRESVTLELREVTVRDAVQQLLGKRKIDFFFDETEIKEAGVATDEVQVSCDLHNVSLRAGLKRILLQARLSWVCDDAGILITTPDIANRTLFARVYDVADLMELATVEVVPPPSKLQQAQFGSGPPALLQPGDGGAARAGEAPKVAPPQEKVLMEMIQQTTGGPANGPWMEADGEGGGIHFIQTARVKLLVIRQNEDVHAQVEDLLNELISHHNEFSEEPEEGATPPKNAVRSRVRVPVQRFVQRESVKTPAQVSPGS